jgi:FkbM family methyltransferase
MKLVEVDAIFGRINAFQHDLITDQIIEFGAHTRPELAFFLNIVRPGDLVFDIGGHIGTFSIPIAQRIGKDGRVLVVEGNNQNFDVLCGNLARLGLENALPVEYMIGMKGRAYVSYTRDRNTGASYFQPSVENNGTAASTLDELAALYFIPRVMKLDIEGMEAISLRSAENILLRRPIIYLEVAEELLAKQGSTAAEIDGLLRPLGYRFFHNVGDRNGAHDKFQVQELSSLQDGGDFFDALAVHKEDDRLANVLGAIEAVHEK